MLKQILFLIVMMLSVGFGYYFFYDSLAHSVLRVGVIPWVTGVAVLLFIFSRLLGFLFDTKKDKKIVNPVGAAPNIKKLDPKMVVVGLLVGLLIALPMIVVFVWLFTQTK